MNNTQTLGTIPMSNRTNRLVTLLLLGLASACGGETGDSWQGTVTDSAGVTIVANPEGGLWAEGEAWTFAEEYRVGGMDAEETAQFGLVVGIDVDTEGNVYVADQQAAQISVFGPDGAFVRTIGSPGAGPGEIGLALTGVWVKAGELWAADVANMRVNRYTLDGDMLGSEPLDFSRGIPIRWDRVEEAIVAQKRGIPGLGSEENPIGDPVVTVGQDPQDTVMILGKGESLEMSESGQARLTLFQQEPLWDAAVDGRLLSAVNSQFRIEVRDPAGTLRQVITRQATARPVTDSDKSKVEAALRSLMLAQGAPPPAVEQFMSGLGFAPTWPLMAQLLAGPNGTVLVQRLRTTDDLGGEDEEFNPQDLGSDDWDIFDADGRYLGVLTMPTKFAPLRVDGDAFWGVQRDEFDVASVVRYRLARD
jgi:hypothetical protein